MITVKQISLPTTAGNIDLRLNPREANIDAVAARQVCAQYKDVFGITSEDRAAQCAEEVSTFVRRAIAESTNTKQSESALGAAERIAEAVVDEAVQQSDVTNVVGATEAETVVWELVVHD